MRREALVILCAVAILQSAPVRAHDGKDHGAAPAPQPAVSGNRWGARYFPNIELTTQDGTKVRLYDDLLKGKSVALNVIYTSCKDECPLETAILAQVQRILGDRMGKDIFFYSISIDPEKDTPQVLKAYAAKFGAGPGWLFLTGEPAHIRLITRKLGLLRSRDANTRDGHSAILMVGNEPTGQWMRNSAVDNPQFLATTIGNFLGWRDQRPQQSYAEAHPIDMSPGEYLFQSKCSSCHTIGQGEKLAPDLLGITSRRERTWLARYIHAPDLLLAAGDPIAAGLSGKYRDIRMPNLRLSKGEVGALLQYLEAPKP
jgi:protein SCO1/2